MGILHIVKIGHPVLRKACEPLHPDVVGEKKFQRLLKEMVATLHKAEGVGLAANQVGLGIQLVMLECKGSRRYPDADHFPLEIYLNPRVVEHSKEKEEDWEGCLSIPGYRGRVPRFKKITFEAVTHKGERVHRTVSGFHARVIQHEVDHINGFFYMDRMGGLKTWMHLEEFNRLADEPVRDRG